MGLSSSIRLFPFSKSKAVLQDFQSCGMNGVKRIQGLAIALKLKPFCISWRLILSLMVVNMNNLRIWELSHDLKLFGEDRDSTASTAPKADGEEIAYLVSSFCDGPLWGFSDIFPCRWVLCPPALALGYWGHCLCTPLALTLTEWYDKVVTVENLPPSACRVDWLVLHRSM